VETFRDISCGPAGKRASGPCAPEGFCSRDANLEEILRILPQVAQSEATVLLLGESGTGKEFFARAIHNLSSRREGPFVALNCGALPEQLMESELFGYKAGAFTDARRDKPGRFQLAEGGTILLDEIGDLPLPLQAKILRVLQERVFEPLGGVAGVAADVRVIAATNRDLERMVAEGSFRQDLYYRLNVVRMTLPPLRERRDDIPLLVDNCLKRRSQAGGKVDIQGLSAEAMRLLMAHPFPGNIRELENIIEYASILCPGGLIQVEHLPGVGGRRPPAQHGGHPLPRGRGGRGKKRRQPQRRLPRPGHQQGHVAAHPEPGRTRPSGQSGGQSAGHRQPAQQLAHSPADAPGPLRPATDAEFVRCRAANAEFAPFRGLQGEVAAA